MKWSLISIVFQKECDLRIKSFGHAGDRNLHAYMLKDDLNDEEWEKQMTKPWKWCTQKPETWEVRCPGNMVSDLQRSLI